jgi:UDP-N-acetylmuramoyl-tripeptide--D-alanyl-D-alanine ligase
VNKFKYTIPAAGIHNIYNALPGVVIGKIYGLSDKEIQAGLGNFKNVKMRQDIYDFNGVTIIDDCYNASLESVRAAFETLSKINKNKKIAVLSDILETGAFAKEIHTKIGEAAAESKIDKIFVCGEESKLIFDFINDVNRCVYFNDKSEIAERLFSEAQKGDAVLFKASRGMALETVIEDFKKLF